MVMGLFFWWLLKASEMDHSNTLLSSLPEWKQIVKKEFYEAKIFIKKPETKMVPSSENSTAFTQP